MNDASIQAQINDLRQQLRHHERQYYVFADPQITDLQYDKLLEHLATLEKSHPQFADANSPTMRMGDQPLSNLRQVRHRVPMLSIENTYSEAELRSFIKRTNAALDGQSIRWIVEWKIDGVAASLVYIDGNLMTAITRGNGEIGDDITHNIRTIRSLPIVLNGQDVPADFELRGEVYMTNDDLVSLNEQRTAAGESAFKNTRNVTAGTIRLLDAKIAASRNLRFLVHGIGYCSELPAETHLGFLKKLESWGVPATPEVTEFENVDDLIEHCHERIERMHELDFEVDGLVIKVDSFAQRESLGLRSKSPRWLIAYKIEKYEAETQMLDITLQVGKTGAITPVGSLAAVQLAGTTVSRCSLHNFDEIHRKDIRVGDWVTVEKAGKIIPHIVRVEKHRRQTELAEYPTPKNCPSCDTELVRDEGGVYIRCPSPTCPEQWRQRLRYFAMRDCMDIEGLGDKVIDLLVSHELVLSYKDLYALQAESISSLPRQGKRSAEKLIEQIAASKNRELSQVLNAISIRHVGKGTSEKLAKRYVTMESLIAASVEDLAATDEVGEIIAESVYAFLHGEAGQAIINQLRAAGVRLEQTVAPNPDAATLKLDGLTFVLTGTLSKPRRDVQRAIEAAGGKVSGSVSKNTNFLVAGDEAGSKLTQAKKLNVNVLTEVELEAKLA